MYRVVQEKIFPIPERLGFKSPLHLDIHKAIYFWFKFTNNLPDKYLHTVNPLDKLTSIHANMPHPPWMAKISSLQEIENFSGTTHLSRLQLGLPLMSKIIWHKKYGKI